MSNLFETAAARVRLFIGIGMPRYQLVLAGIAVAVSGLFWFLQGEPNLAGTFIFTFVVGNITVVLLAILAPLFSRRSPLTSWLVFLLLLLPVAAIGSLAATLVLLVAFGVQGVHRTR